MRNSPPVGSRVAVVGQSITGTVVRYDGTKAVVLDDAREEWREDGEEGVLVFSLDALEVLPSHFDEATDNPNPGDR